MTSATLEPLQAVIADPVLVKSVADGVKACLAMCGAEARCVGLSAVPASDRGSVTGMIGVHGEASGFITVNLAEKAAFSLVGGLLQERFDSLTDQVIDGVGEITNIIAGGIKKGLGGTAWSYSHVTVPSVIVGQHYQIAYSKGLEYVSVTFEQENVETVMLDDRLIEVAISLIRL